MLSNGAVNPLRRSPSLRLIYPSDFFKGYPAGYMSFVEPFISKLESFLNTKRHEVDLGAEFIKAGISNQLTMQDYLFTVVNPFSALPDIYL